jgi:hypothetical protein
MAGQSFTAEEMAAAGLSEEEIEGLTDDSDDEALKEIAGEDDTPPADDEPPADDAPPSDDAPPADLPADDEPPQDEPPADEEPEEAFTPEAAAPPKAPAAFDFDAREGEYQQAVLDGDKEKATAIRKEIRAAEKAEAKYEAEVAAFNMIQQSQQATADATWKREQSEFFGDHKEYKANDILYGALNTAVVKLATAYPAKSGSWVLKEAHRQVQAAFGRAPEPKKEPEVRPKPERPEVLNKTLGGLPNAATEDTGADEFAHLDGLSGEALEKALEKMPKSQQEKYAKG